MSTGDRGETKQRLRAAAAALFAERGFHGATMRDLAERGGVNLAASHYHYGSKRDLYLEVLREQFAAVRSELERSGAALPARGLRQLGRDALIELLRLRSRVMLTMLIGTPPALHGALMQREMCDPSEALPVIVDEFLQPMMLDLQRILTLLAPGLKPATIERCAFSIVGQAMFYQITRPALQRMKNIDSYPANFIATTADHIVEFSLGGLERLAEEQNKRSRRKRGEE